VLEHSIKSMFVPARQLRCVCPSESLMRHRTEKFYHERLVNTHACKIRCTDASTHVRSRFADCCTIVQTRHKRASRTALPTLLPTSNVIDLRCGPVPKKYTPRRAQRHEHSTNARLPSLRPFTLS
jgi:hypothetical protein